MWEYKTLSEEAPFSGEFLNQLGQDNWELVTVVVGPGRFLDQAVAGSRTHTGPLFHYFFKRQTSMV